MTDTPRTRAELLTDFANQQNHGITAQKMRNLVVSNSDPVAGGGMGVAIGSDEVALSLKAAGDFANNGNPYTLPSGSTVWLPMGIRSDPNGWVSTTTVDSDYNGGTVPADSAIQLPKGIYIAGTDIVFHTEGDIANLSFWFDWIDDPGPTDLVFGNPGGFFSPFFGMRDNQPAAASGGDYCAAGFLRVTQAMEDAGLRIAPRMAQSRGTNVLFNFCDLLIARIA